MRPPRANESSFLRLFSFYGMDYALLHVTRTALDKGYTDATSAFRRFLSRHGVHDFGTQGAGKDLIRYLEVTALTVEGGSAVQLSFQRPATKGGRMYRVSKLGTLKAVLNLLPDDLILCSVQGSKLYLANLTSVAEGRVSNQVSEPNPTASRGATIISAAKDHLLRVMNLMPECKAETGTGAKGAEIGELTGMMLDWSRFAIANAVLEELLLAGKIEVASNKPRRYRLCR